MTVLSMSVTQLLDIIDRLYISACVSAFSTGNPFVALGFGVVSSAIDIIF